MPNRISETNSHDHNLTTASQAHHKTQKLAGYGNHQGWGEPYISHWLRAVYSHSEKSGYGHLYDGIAQMFEASQNTTLKKYLFFLKHKLEGNIQEH